MRNLQIRPNRKLSVRATVAAALALALVVGPARAQGPSSAPRQHAYDLAREIVLADGLRARLSRLDVLGPVQSHMIAGALNLTDSTSQDRVKGIVQQHLQAVEDEMVEARVSVLAQTYSVEEMQGAVDFGRTPTGQALRAAAPDLNRALSAAFLGVSAPATAVSAMSERKIALVKRILAAREVEASAHKGWRTLNGLVSQLSPEAAKLGAAPELAVKDRAAEAAYVGRVVAVESEFYGRTFSDRQLADMATYFEGPSARAFVDREQQARSAAAKMVSQIFERQLKLMYDQACVAVACNASQSAALSALLDQSRSMVETATRVTAL